MKDRDLGQIEPHPHMDQIIAEARMLPRVGDDWALRFTETKGHPWENAPAAAKNLINSVSARAARMGGQNGESGK